MFTYGGGPADRIEDYDGEQKAGIRLTYQGEDGIYLEASVDPEACKPVWYWRAEFDLYFNGEPLHLPAKKFALYPDVEVNLAQIMCNAGQPEISPATVGLVWVAPTPPPEPVAVGQLWLKDTGELMRRMA